MVISSLWAAHVKNALFLETDLHIGVVMNVFIIF